MPALLSQLAGWPLPRATPSIEAMRRALADGWAPDGVFVLKALALVCWVAWAQAAFCVGAKPFDSSRSMYSISCVDSSTICLENRYLTEGGKSLVSSP